MTPVWTRRIHDSYWKHINELCSGDEELRRSVPVLIWDFNAANKHLKDEWQAHVNFWQMAVRWGRTTHLDPRLKTELREKINDILYLGGCPEDSWYDTSRKKKVKKTVKVLVVEEMIGFRGEEIFEEERSLELANTSGDPQDVWCPGWTLEWKMITRPSFYASLAGTAQLIARGEWPHDDYDTHPMWKNVMQGICKSQRLTADHLEFIRIWNSGHLHHRELLVAVAKAGSMSDDQILRLVKSGGNVWEDL